MRDTTSHTDFLKLLKVTYPCSSPEIRQQAAIEHSIAKIERLNRLSQHVIMNNIPYEDRFSEDKFVSFKKASRFNSASFLHDERNFPYLSSTVLSSPEEIKSDSLDLALKHHNKRLSKWLMDHHENKLFISTQTLCLAAEAGYFDIVVWLLSEERADSRQQPSTSSTLHAAARSGNSQLMQWLLTTYPDKLCVDKDTVDYAVESGNSGTVRWLMSIHPEIEVSQYTLCVAAGSGDFPTFFGILTKISNPIFDDSLLDMAISSGCSLTVEYLCFPGRFSGQAITSRHLMTAIAFDDCRILKFLLKYATIPEVNQQHLETAAEFGSVNILKKDFFNYDVLSINEIILNSAARSGNLTAVQFLLESVNGEYLSSESHCLELISNALQSGSLVLLKWLLIEIFKQLYPGEPINEELLISSLLKFPENYQRKIWSLLSAVETGNLSFAEWIYCSIPLEYKDVSLSIPKPTENVGSIKSCLHGTFTNPQQLLLTAASTGNFSLVMWVVTNFPCQLDTNFLWSSLVSGSVPLLAWALKRGTQVTDIPVPSLDRLITKFAMFAQCLPMLEYVSLKFPGAFKHIGWKLALQFSASAENPFGLKWLFHNERKDARVDPGVNILIGFLGDRAKNSQTKRLIAEKQDSSSSSLQDIPWQKIWFYACNSDISHAILDWLFDPARGAIVDNDLIECVVSREVTFRWFVESFGDGYNDRFDQNCLNRAARSGCVEIIKWILRSKPELTPDRLTLHSSLHAIYHGPGENDWSGSEAYEWLVAKYQLSASASANEDTMNYCLYYEQCEAVKYLIKHNPAIKPAPAVFLFHATFGNSEWLYHTFLKLYPQVNPQQFHLHLAARNGNSRLVSCLCFSGTHDHKLEPDVITLYYAEQSSAFSAQLVSSLKDAIEKVPHEEMIPRYKEALMRVEQDPGLYPDRSLIEWLREKCPQELGKRCLKSEVRGLLCNWMLERPAEYQATQDGQGGAPAVTRAASKRRKL